VPDTHRAVTLGRPVATDQPDEFMRGIVGVTLDVVVEP
jgi:hypothetical protein